jgi:hypothetical protein
VSKPPVLEALGLRLSEKQIPQVVGFIRKGLKQRELLEGAAMRPMQLDYPGAAATIAFGVNPGGVIVGQHSASGSVHAFVALPASD